MASSMHPTSSRIAKSVTLAVAAGAALAVAWYSVTATVAVAASDPGRLVLQRSDFPAGTAWSSTRATSLERSLKQAGIVGRATGYTAVVPQGKTEELLVSGLVITLADATQATRVFASYRNPFPAAASDITRLSTSFGDEQLAIVTKGVVRADLRVRKGSTVWRLEIKWAGTDRLTRARALLELKRYATKQQRRIGG